MDLMSILMIAVGILIFAIIGLIFAYWVISRKNKNIGDSSIGASTQDASKKVNQSSADYTRLSVFDFMEFDKIEDNMIIQNNGARYLMVIGCEGINYDLMSEIEKTSVEQGFVQFLNTLRHPVQLYTQTRTINISNSIENYTKRINDVKMELDKKREQLNRTIQYGGYDAEQIKNLRMEIARLQNLYDYGVDIVANVEKMSSNKNVLRQHYFIIVPYYEDELGARDLSEEEKRNMIFGELYTRAQSISRTLFACSMKSKILNSEELIELLYVAYNRDESEVYTLEKALKAGFTELYSTAPDVLDKKLRAINSELERRSLELAKDTVDAIRSEKEKAINKKQESFDDILNELAVKLIKNNKKYIGEDTANEAVEKLSTKEGGTANETIKKTKTRKTRAS